MLWQLHSQNVGLQKDISEGLGLSKVTAQVLINRGLTDDLKAKRFLYPTLTNLHDPFLMADMERSVERVMRAIASKESILIYGDYDADGATSTALMVRFFKNIGVDVHYYIPHRIDEGYGMHKDAMGPIKKLGTKLIITVDNGSSAHEEIEYANELGIDVIVTDHHEIQGELPKAYAVINPKRSDCNFPFKELAGVGVAFNLLMALRQRLRETGFFKDKEEPRLKDLLDLVAIGTVADVVPLIDENRVFVKFGIEEIKKSSNKGITALKIVSGLETPSQINAMTIAFRLAPRINAAGRIGDQHIGVRLLMTENAEEALELAHELNDLNVKRQAIEAAILKQAEAMIKADKGLESSLAVVLYSDTWHIGVLGIVASRIAETYKKPAVIIGIHNGVARGSARGIGDYNIVEALSKASRNLKGFGGHRHAAGLNVDIDKIEAFKKDLIAIANKTVTDADRAGKMPIDAQIEPGDVTEQLIKELELLEPFGRGNPEPVFSLKELRVSDSKIVAEKHLKLKFTDNIIVLEGIGFGMANRTVTASDILDVAFIPQMDTWKGNGAIQLKLMDIKDYV